MGRFPSLPIHLTHHLLQHIQRVEVDQLLLSLDENRLAMGPALDHQASALGAGGLAIKKAPLSTGLSSESGSKPPQFRSLAVSRAAIGQVMIQFLGASPDPRSVAWIELRSTQVVE